METSNSAELAASQFPVKAGESIDSEWTLRPWILGALLGLSGLLLHFLTDGHERSPGWMALAAFVYFGSIFAAFTLDRDRWIRPLIAAAIAGLVMAGLAWRAVDPQNHLADEEFAFAAGVIATTLALPLFQAGFHRMGFKTPYRDTHFHIWTDAVSGGGALAFVGLSWALIAVLSQLFLLLKIEFLKDLIDQAWFGWAFSGLAFGAALGTLRNQLKVLGTLQSVVLLVLSLLAVPLALALVFFLLAMILSGPDVLWQATRSATPILLTCAFGAFVLTNSILRDEDSAMTRSRIMRVSALILAIGILPLTVFAAISMGTRVAQHGLTPERLWGLVAIGFACAYGLAYVVALVRGRRAAWHGYLRQANLHLAVAGCVLAMVLALPIFDFGSISARNQLARLESGTVTADQFDFAALRWDFGDGGRTALARLAKNGASDVQTKAREALAQKERPWSSSLGMEEPDKQAARKANLRMQFDDPALKDKVASKVLSDRWTCQSPCVALDLGASDKGTRRIVLLEERGRTFYDIDMKADAPDDRTNYAEESGIPGQPVKADSTVEIRPFTGRRIYVDGKPSGDPFE